MRSIMKFFGAVTAGLIASTTPAYAVGVLPEPGTIGLVALGVAGVIYLAKRRK